MSRGRRTFGWGAIVDELRRPNLAPAVPTFAAVILAFLFLLVVVSVLPVCPVVSAPLLVISLFLVLLFLFLLLFMSIRKYQS